MKRSEIKVGNTYHNGKQGRFYTERLVLAEGPEYLLYPGQADNDCIQYRTVKKGDKEVNLPAENMTRTRFASWAKGEIHPLQ